MMSFLRKYPLRVLSLVLIALLVSFAALVATVSIPRTIDRTENDTDIFITASRGFLLVDACVEISWQVDGISAMYYNSVGAIGAYTETLCLQDRPQNGATFSIISQNNTFKEYHLPIVVLSESTVFWGISIFAISLLILSFVTLPVQEPQQAIDSGRRHILKFVGALIIGVVVGGVTTVLQQREDNTIVVCDGWVLKASDLQQTNCTGTE